MMPFISGDKIPKGEIPLFNSEISPRADSTKLSVRRSLEYPQFGEWGVFSGFGPGYRELLFSQQGYLAPIGPEISNIKADVFFNSSYLDRLPDLIRDDVSERYNKLKEKVNGIVKRLEVESDENTIEEMKQNLEEYREKMNNIENTAKSYLDSGIAYLGEEIGKIEADVDQKLVSSFLSGFKVKLDPEIASDAARNYRTTNEYKRLFKKSVEESIEKNEFVQSSLRNYEKYGFDLDDVALYNVVAYEKMLTGDSCSEKDILEEVYEAKGFKNPGKIAEQILTTGAIIGQTGETVSGEFPPVIIKKRKIKEKKWSRGKKIALAVGSVAAFFGATVFGAGVVAGEPIHFFKSPGDLPGFIKNPKNPDGDPFPSSIEREQGLDVWKYNPIQDIDKDRDGLLNGADVTLSGGGSLSSALINLGIAYETHSSELTFLGEKNFSTNPEKYDTSGDGLSDGKAVQLGLNPLEKHPLVSYGLKKGLDDQVLKLLGGVEKSGQTQDFVDYISSLDNKSAKHITQTFLSDKNLNETESNQIKFLSSLGVILPRDSLINFDLDWDKILNYEEKFTYGTDFSNPDTDDDNLNDYEEINNHHTDPLNPDTDNDGLSDGDEVSIHHTDPLNPDTDNDGYKDPDEIHEGSDPLNSKSTPLNKDANEFLDAWELKYFGHLGVNPNGNPDNDGLTNLREYQIGTDPTNNDTDNDGMPDGWEDKYGLSPLVKDSVNDKDDDGLTNIKEYKIGTNPTKKDTEDDGMPDGWENENGLNPSVNDSYLDRDGDWLTNLQEFLNNTNPNKKDTDSDGFGDWDEVVIYKSNPLQKNWAGYFVSDDVYPLIKNSLENYTKAIKKYYGIDTKTFRGNWTDPLELRQAIIQNNTQGMIGASLVGNIPTAVLNVTAMTAMVGYKAASDLVYMDKDFQWVDENHNGYFDINVYDWDDDKGGNPDGDNYISEIKGEVKVHERFLDIAIGRIKTPYTDLNQRVDALNQYFEKTKRYVDGNLTAENKAIVFIDECAMGAYGDHYNKSYPIVEYMDAPVLEKYRNDSINPDGPISNATNYKKALKESVEFLSLACHGNPRAVGFFSTLSSNLSNLQGVINWQDIKNIETKPLFVRIESCNVGNFYEYDNIALYYPFSKGNTLVCMAPSLSAFSHSIPTMEDTLNKGKPIGLTFLEGHEHAFDANDPDRFSHLYYRPVSFSFGDVLIGDWILKT